MKNKKKKQKQNTKTVDSSGIRTLKDLWEFLKESRKTILLIEIIILAVYANIIGGDFVTADDPEIFRYINSHTYVQSLKELHIESFYMGTLNALFGLNPTAFHVSSIIIHMINAVLAFSLAYILTEDKKTATYATLIFSVHPALSEAVAWISGRAYLFHFLLGAPILILFILYRKSNKKDYLAASTLIYIFGLFFWRNPWILVIPFLLAGIDQFVLSNKIDFKKIKSYIPIIAITSIYMIFIFINRYSKRVESLEAKYRYDPVSTTPLINRIPYTIYMAARQLLWPIQLSIYHEGVIITKPLYTFMICVATAVVGTIIYLYVKKKDRATAVFMALILVSILPTFSPIVVAWFIADRYLYFGALLFGIIIIRILMKMEKKHRIKDLTTIVVILLLMFYGIRTFVRTFDFKTNKNLWLATKKTAPFSRRVYNNLGDVYSKEGNWPLAIENFKRSVEISPNYAEAIHNLGYTYMQMGDVENAKKYLLLSYQKNPTIFQALYKLGIIAQYEGKLDEALMYMEKALEIVPNDPQIQGLAQQIRQQMAQQQANIPEGESAPNPNPSIAPTPQP